MNSPWFWYAVALLVSAAGCTHGTLDAGCLDTFGYATCDWHDRVTRRDR